MWFYRLAAGRYLMNYPDCPGLPREASRSRRP